MIIGTLKRWKLAADCPYVVFRDRVKSRGGKQMTAKGGTVGAWVIEGGRGGTLLLNCLLKFAKFTGKACVLKFPALPFTRVVI
jgi:hypothetical protein